MKREEIIYSIVRAVFRGLSRLPFRVLYCLSDMAFVIVYYIVRYRRRVVRNNLTTSFPEKSLKEIKRIERGFYHFLCDYPNETIKLLTMTPEMMLKHIEFRGIERVEECFDRGQSCAGILGHYGNWEWLSATGISYRRHKDVVTGLIYHPLSSSKLLDRLFLEIRQSMGGVCIPKNAILRHLLKYKQENRMTIFGYIADQAPKWENIHLWLDFLNHDTPVFTGAERIMRKMNNAVFYLDMQRQSRGHYVCTYRLITDRPQEMEEYEITRRFFAMLEEAIRENPQTYLWTHNRWKRTREEFDRKFRECNAHVIPK